jgi:3',5'-cyclic AMP phosphodiesterase CpdA
LTRTIAHVSDLHFGRIDAPVAEGLVSDLSERHPTLLVASGDFTQRARTGQYAAAREYLKRLPGPQLVVPGNHDIPMFDVLRRFLFPLNRYRRYISPDLDPVFQDDRLFVMGINTARSFTHKSGWMSDVQLAEIRQRFAAVASTTFKVLVTHHPFFPPPREPNADVIVGAERYLAQLEPCGMDLLLAGHLHVSYHDDLRSHYKPAGRSILSVQAGTATSTRRRGEPNAYNWITLSDDLCTIAVRSWNGREFVESRVTRYRRIEGVWRAELQAGSDAAGTKAIDGPMLA